MERSSTKILLPKESVGYGEAQGKQALIHLAVLVLLSNCPNNYYCWSKMTKTFQKGLQRRIMCKLWQAERN